MIKVMGLDPGKTGGLAIIKGNDEYECFGFAKLTRPDIAELIREKMSEIDICYLEKVHAMPAQGVTSVFKFGSGYGHLEGILDALLIRYEHVTPQKWQKELGCLSGGDKNVTKTKAQQLFPLIDKITHQTADALLIAKYGFDKENR